MNPTSTNVKTYVVLTRTHRHLTRPIGPNRDGLMQIRSVLKVFLGICPSAPPRFVDIKKTLMQTHQNLKIFGIRRMKLGRAGRHHQSS